MTKANLLVLGENPSLRVGRGPVLRVLVVFAALCSCATGQPRDGLAPPHEGKLPPTDLFCERDDDCEILDTSFDECCFSGETEPFAISHAAVKRYQARRKYECAGAICTEEGVSGCCCTKLKDWIAVCVGHICKRRSKLFDLPKAFCPWP